MHDEHNHTMAFLLATLEPPNFPVALGVLYHHPGGTSFERGMQEQNRQARAKGLGDLNALMRKGHTWVVEPEPT